MVLEQNLSLVNKVNRLLRWGHWYTFFNVALALIVTASYFFADPWPSTAMGWLYLLSNWIGHTAFLCFLFFIVTIFPVSLLFPSQRHVRGIAAILATSGLVALIFDAYVYHNLGYHAGSASYEQTIDLLRQQVVTNLRNFILITATVATVLLAVQLVLSNFCWKKIERLKRSGIGKPALILLLGSFSLSHVLHIWADATQVQEITRQDNSLPLTYPATARTVLAKYQLLDRDSLNQSDSLSWLQQAGLATKQVQLQCTANPLVPIQIWLVDKLELEQKQLLQLQNFKHLPQHMAPAQQALAISQLLYGQLTMMDLQQAPSWWSQLAAGTVGVNYDAYWQHQLPWTPQYNNATAPIQFVLKQDPAELSTMLKARAADRLTLIIELTGQSGQFALGQAQFWYYWPQLHQQRISQVSQHLDLMPTLLSAMGCQANNSWVGDDLLQPVTQAKLNIIGRQLYSFRKDKMLVVNEDGQYSVWSAGTSVRLEQKPDLPMLTDALNRLTKPQP